MNSHGKSKQSFKHCHGTAALDLNTWIVFMNMGPMGSSHCGLKCKLLFWKNFKTCICCPVSRALLDTSTIGKNDMYSGHTPLWAYQGKMTCESMVSWPPQTKETK